jgi:hypothetical protein
MNRNPVVATRYKQKGSVKAHIVDTKAHYTAASTRIAQNAVDEVLRGNGKYLGSGNFGVAYEVNSDGRKRLVKMGSFDTIHSRGYARRAAEQGIEPDRRRLFEEEAGKMRRTKEGMRRAILHEAGVANELWDAGFRCVPFTVYVERGLPALVREYGDIDGEVTRDQLDQLSLELTAIQDAGWSIQDELLLARRIYAESGAPKGSLFVADVGIWQWRGRKPDTEDIRSLHNKMERAFKFPSLAELNYWEAQLQRDIARLENRPDYLIYKINLKNSEKVVAGIRRARG